MDVCCVNLPWTEVCVCVWGGDLLCTDSKCLTQVFCDTSRMVHKTVFAMLAMSVNESFASSGLTVIACARIPQARDKYFSVLIAPLGTSQARGKRFKDYERIRRVEPAFSLCKSLNTFPLPLFFFCSLNHRHRRASTHTER